MINGKLSKKRLTRPISIFLLLGIGMDQLKKQPELVTQKKNLIMQLRRKFPLLAFIVDSSMSMTADKFETDIQKIAKLSVFKEKVKQSGRYVKFWKNVDNLETLISQSISKAVIRGNRPGGYEQRILT